MPGDGTPEADVGKAGAAAKRAPLDVDRHVGKRLRFRRVELGLSQQDLAERAELTFQQIQKYEKGTNRISASRLYEFAGLLDVPVSYFFDGMDAGDAVLEEQDRILAVYSGMSERGAGLREFMELNRAYTAIENPDLRRQVLNMITSIVEELPDLISGRMNTKPPSQPTRQRVRARRKAKTSNPTAASNKKPRRRTDGTR